MLQSQSHVMSRWMIEQRLDFKYRNFYFSFKLAKIHSLVISYMNTMCGWQLIEKPTTDQSKENKWSSKSSALIQTPMLYISPSRLLEYHRKGDGEIWKVGSLRRLLQNNIVWTWHGCDTHELLAAMITLTRLAWDPVELSVLKQKQEATNSEHSICFSVHLLLLGGYNLNFSDPIKEFGSTKI